MECELLRSPMISYRSLLYNTTVLYDNTTVLYDYRELFIIINKYCAEPLHIEYKHRKDTTKYNQVISSVKLMLD